MNILVTGGSRGLGAAVIQAQLEQFGGDVMNWDVKGDQDHPDDWAQVDVSDEIDVRDSARSLMRSQFGVPDVLINCVGVNEINWLEDTDPRDWDRVLAVNAKSLFLLARAFLPKMNHIGGGTILNITSNAAWTPMTGSIAYNTSKAAAHMVTRQLAHEVTRRGQPSIVFGIAPGKIAGTEMSGYIEKRVEEVRGWSPEYAKEYQLNGLPLKEELPAEVLADFIVTILSDKQRHRYFHGCIIPIGTWMGM